MKTVSAIGHAFDCLPGHVTVTARGTGSNVRVAICDAIRVMFTDKRLYRKRIGDFKLSIVVIADSKEAKGGSR